MMSEAEIEALAADIKAHGLQQRIVLWRESKMSTRPETYFVLDGRNRLDALSRLGVDIPSPEDPREMVTLPGGQIECVFEVANHPNPKHWNAPQVDDPAEFVIGANIRRRHLTKEQQAELIVKTIAARQSTDRAAVARSVKRRANGRVNGSIKDPVLAKAVTEAQKHGISKRTVQTARAKMQGKTPAPRKPPSLVNVRGPAAAAAFKQPPPPSEAIPLGSPTPSAASSSPSPAAPALNVRVSIEMISTLIEAEYQKYPVTQKRDFDVSLAVLMKVRPWRKVLGKIVLGGR
jgi:hypothetical protein